MGQYRLGLVGESKYQDSIEFITEGEPVTLEHEPGNRHDKRAVRAVSRLGGTIGYAPRDSWVQRALIDEKADLFARVDSINGSKRKRGVVLMVWTGADAAIERARPVKRRGGCLGVVAGLLVIGLAVLARPEAQAASSASQVESDAAGHCAVRYPDDFAMRAACVRNARRGAESYAGIEAQHSGNPAMQRALSRCVSRYTEGGRVDWSMAGACARNQQRGWEETRQ